MQLGCGDGTLTAELAADGRFIVHALDPDAKAVAAAQRLLHSRGLYGIGWAERHASARLPYTENLVNLIVVTGSGPQVPDEEIRRVLAPRGVACFRRSGAWERVEKPRPAEMGEWPMPRHGPDGNAASGDRLVGPPRRVRWINGPWHESSHMVTAGGRFYHGGLIVRDAFNGLRLWERPISPAPLRLGYTSSGPAGSVVPVLAGDRVFAFTDKQVVALDPAAGRTLQAYPEAGRPVEFLCDRGILVAMARTGLRAVDAASGKLLWRSEGKEIDALISGGDAVFFLEGDVKRGETRSLNCLDRATGRARWRKTDFPWLPRVRRLSHSNGVLICEISTFKDDKRGNAIEALSAADGAFLWERVYEPGVTHYTQARAIQVDGLVWVLLKGKWQGLDPRDGTPKRTCAAGGGHCFPPVGTPRFLFTGEMNFTDLATGKVDANRITKGNCSREMGTMLANGLVYTGPKHCSCWPMLRGYSAMAPAGGAAERLPAVPPPPVVERGPAFSEIRNAQSPTRNATDWPSYRSDIWRSASTPSAVPTDLDVLWTARLGGWPKGPLTEDWTFNLHSRGPITPPVVAGGLVVVARPEAHQVVAFDAQTGERRWDFTANGRVDTPPTLHAGLCLFGTRSGWVYCLRAVDGRLAWRLRAAPAEERIVAFGQLESPWPVPGTVLVVDGVACFAAGRQSLADGGIFIYAVEPATGRTLWAKRLNSLPMTGFYNGLGLEFDPFDLLVAEAAKPPAPAAQPGPDLITMSRWRFAPKTGKMTVAAKSGFARFRTSGHGVMAPRGVWSYGPRMDYCWRPNSVHAAPRPLMAFRGSTLVGSSDDKRQLFRTDFSPETLGTFNDAWYSHGQVARKKDDTRDHNRAERLSRIAAWTVDVVADPKSKDGVAALVLAGDTVFAAGQEGRLVAFALADGRRIAERGLPAPVWDGLAAANGRLYVATRDGSLICLGKK